MRLTIVHNLDDTLRFLLLDDDGTLIASSVDYTNYEDCLVGATIVQAETLFADIEYLPPTDGTFTMRFEVEP
ncbi:hypothetical protein [Exiguobacterium sp. UBA5002]|uniref:hypothetical protein n=1 Tax=Exiguobacterium sp. UBA5002 TaxID=1946497 RepID=UPI0025C725E6|nr:hypothetical protein [Exiguobacterium sp. UBA5002]